MGQLQPHQPGREWRETPAVAQAHEQTQAQRRRTKERETGIGAGVGEWGKKALRITMAGKGVAGQVRQEGWQSRMIRVGEEAW